MRCKAGRTGGPADEDFELSRFYHFKQGAGDDGGGDEDEEECRMENIQPVLPFLAKRFPPMISGLHCEDRIQI